MRNILGGKDGVCPHCKGMMIYLKVGKCKIFSQCKSCGCLISGRAKDAVKIYSYSEDR